MTFQTPSKEEPTDHLPLDLQEQVFSKLPKESVGAAAPFDLDSRGRYIEGYLVLADHRLGEFVRHPDGWDGRWTEIGGISEVP